MVCGSLLNKPEGNPFVDEERRLPFSEDEEELLLVGLPMEKETLMEVIKVLEEEITFSGNANNGDTNANPLSLMMYSTSSSFVTINGNEESCGPSFDTSSTVMASVDMGNISISYFMGPMSSGGRKLETFLFLPFSVKGSTSVTVKSGRVTMSSWIVSSLLGGAPFEFNQEWSHDSPHSGF